MWGFALIIVNVYEPKPWLSNWRDTVIQSKGKPLEYNIFHLVKTCNLISCIAFFIALIGSWMKNRWLLSIYNIFYVNSTIAWSIGLGSIIMLFCFYKQSISSNLLIIMIIIIIILSIRGYFLYHIQIMINTLSLQKENSRWRKSRHIITILFEFGLVTIGIYNLFNNKINASLLPFHRYIQYILLCLISTTAIIFGCIDIRINKKISTRLTQMLFVTSTIVLISLTAEYMFKTMKKGAMIYLEYDKIYGNPYLDETISKIESLPFMIIVELATISQLKMHLCLGLHRFPFAAMKMILFSTLELAMLGFAICLVWVFRVLRNESGLNNNNNNGNNMLLYVQVSNSASCVGIFLALFGILLKSKICMKIHDVIHINTTIAWIISFGEVCYNLINLPIIKQDDFILICLIFVILIIIIWSRVYILYLIDTIGQKLGNILLKRSRQDILKIKSIHFGCWIMLNILEFISFCVGIYIAIKIHVSQSFLLHRYVENIILVIISGLSVICGVIQSPCILKNNIKTNKLIWGKQIFSVLFILSSISWLIITVEYIVMEGYGVGGGDNWIKHLDVNKKNNWIVSAVFLVISQLRIYGCFQLFKFCNYRQKTL